MKRCSEIKANEVGYKTKTINGRGYFYNDLQFLFQTGISSSYAGILVFALYIHSNDVALLYSSVHYLWVACFLIMLWMNYLWYSTQKNKMTDDPILFSLKNKTSLFLLILISIVVLVAI